ncbi:MAG TPA: hypothetical protein EYM38_08095 [Dehalococcoidia bacterium]|nr:hypothetical protein [Dehalococcoidia bacterium]
MAIKLFSQAMFLVVSATVMISACGGGDEIPSTLTATTQNSTTTSARPLTNNQSENPAENPTATPEIIPATATATPLPQWKYVNSGWVSPVPEDQVGPLKEDFRAFVITSQEELDEFQARSRIRISRGTTTSLGKIDFPNSILVAGYLMWRPVQGDPLSVVGFNFEAGKGGAAGLAEVRLELEDSPQGRERPYLLAPMTMVALSRTIFSHGEPVDFVFQLNGEAVATVTAAITATGE